MRGAMKKLTALVVAIALAVACGSGGTSSASLPTQPTAAMSTAASAYLNAILDLMQPNSIKRLTIDWTAFRNSVIAAAGSAQTIADLNPAIRVAITCWRRTQFVSRRRTSSIFVGTRTCGLRARRSRRCRPRSATSK